MGLDIYFKIRNKKDKDYDFTFAYFRKVNFLVAYFESLGMDVEYQVPLKISKEDVQNLLELCERVLKDHSLAEELLPTMEGFFFGDTDYNEDYFADVEYVRNQLKDEIIPTFDELDEDEEIYFKIWY